MLVSDIEVPLTASSQTEALREKVFSAKPVLQNSFVNGFYYIVYLPFLWVVSIVSFIRNSMLIVKDMRGKGHIDGLIDLLVKVFNKRKRKRLKKHFFSTAYDIGRNTEHYSSYLFDGISSWNHQVKIYAATARVLDLFYRYEEDIKPMLQRDSTGFWTKFWVGSMHNRIAVKHRLYLVVESMEQQVLHLENRGITTIRGCSVACGTVRAWRILMELFPHLDFEITVIDQDPEAIYLAQKSARALKMEENFTFITGDASVEVSKIHRNGTRFHIIEMVGLNDYLPDAIFVRLTREIKKCLEKDGSYITANIAPNVEKIFLTGVLLWPMIYRRKEDFQALLEKVYTNAEVVSGMWGIHNIAICHNDQ